MFTTNIPSPYRVDFFNELGKYCDLTVLFESHFAKDRDVAWTTDKIQNFTPVYLKGKRVGTAEAICPGVIKYLSKKKYDVIVVGFFSSPTGMMEIEYMRMRQIPFVLSSDGGLIKNDAGIRHKIKQHFIGAANAWLSTGMTTTKYLTYYGADPQRVYVYPFTSVKEKDILRHPLTVGEKQVYRDLLNMTEEKIVLSVGQFIYRKGYDILLKACKELDASTGVYIVGGKPSDEYLQLKEKFGLTHVHFVSFLTKDKLADYYRAADLFVLPTREDIWGLVVNEAMAYGLPVITTDKCIAGLEMVMDGLNGWIVPVDNADELSYAIRKPLTLDVNMVIETARRYSIEKMAERHIEVFSRLITEGIV